MAARPSHRMRGRLFWGVADQAVFSAVSFALAIGVARDASPAAFGAFGVGYVVYTVLLGTVEAYTGEVVIVSGSAVGRDERRALARDAGGAALCAGLVCAVAGAGLLFAGRDAS